MALMSYDEWMKLTTALAKPRSRELKAVDEQLKRVGAGGGDALLRLRHALDAWKATQGPGDAWKRSVRNKKLAVEQLTIQLAGGGDSEGAWGRGDPGMHATFDHARLGVCYLLGKTRVRTDVFSVVLEGGLAITGSVLSYQGGKIEDGGLGKVAVDTAQNVYNTAVIPGSMILSAANSAALDSHLPPERRALAERVKQMFDDFIRKTFAEIKSKLGDTALAYAALKNLGVLSAKLFMDTVGYGLVSGATDTFKGLVSLTNAVIDKVRSYIRSQGVVLMSGHPAVIVESINRAMTLSLLKGVWQTLKGAGNIGLAFATWGIAMIVGIVTACFEMIVKVIWRLVELFRMQRTFDEAAVHWAGRDGPDAFHKKPFAFHHWYRERALNLPALAVLTLNSGICGDKMVYLSMFRDDGDPISSESFLKGAAYLDSLKFWGTSYLEQCGFSFYSGDPFVSAILGHARSHQENLSRGQQVWAEVSKFAGA